MTEERVPTCMHCYRAAPENCGECGVGYCDQHLEVDKDGDSELRLCSRCRYKHYKDRTTFPLVAEDDIVVDDQELEVAGIVTPPDFFDNKDNWGL